MPERIVLSCCHVERVPSFLSSLHVVSVFPNHHLTRQVFPLEPFRNSSYEFQQYQLGIGGPCEVFTPPAGFWCGNHTSGGGASTYHMPSGMIASATVLPNSPYGMQS